MPKTLHFWDLAGTLFTEEWDPESGFSNFSAYLKSLGYNPETISGHDYEREHEKPYKTEMFKLGINKGFRKVFSWTKHNQCFTTGDPDQLLWRAEYINPSIGFDVLDYIKKVNSTFDYSNSNIKNRGMLVELLTARLKEGYLTIVYTDDKLLNCELFIVAAEVVMRKNAEFSWRVYNIKNDESGLHEKQGYWEIGSLLDLLKQEKKLRA